MNSAGNRVSYSGKRALDVLVAAWAMLLAIAPMIFLGILVKLTSHGPVLYWSDRVGRDNVLFRMPKFRTMRTDTPAVATHLLGRPEQYLTPIGGFMRKSSLDELPQIWSILVGNMSLIGPRPALFNQDDLIKLRTEKGVHNLVPGLTGWAQINGRDELPIAQKVELDVEYMKNISLGLDMRIFLKTFFRVLRRDGVVH